MEIFIFKNINFKYYSNISKNISLEIDEGIELKGLNQIFKTIFSKNGDFVLNLNNDLSNENLLNTANKLVHFGWKKEVIPTRQTKKTLIGRLFEAIFN